MESLLSFSLPGTFSTESVWRAASCMALPSRPPEKKEKDNCHKHAIASRMVNTHSAVRFCMTEGLVVKTVAAFEREGPGNGAANIEGCPTRDEETWRRTTDGAKAGASQHVRGCWPL